MFEMTSHVVWLGLLSLECLLHGTMKQPIIRVHSEIHWHHQTTRGTLNKFIGLDCAVFYIPANTV